MTRLHLFYLMMGSVLLFSRCQCDEPIPKCDNCSFTCLSGGEQNVFDNDCPSNWDCSYVLHENSSLNYKTGSFNDQVSIEPGGNKMVFAIQWSTEGEALIIDDEVTRFVFFQVDATNDSFSVENGELDLLDLRYKEECFCADVHLKKPTSGCIQGQLIDESHWRVQANFQVEYDNWTQEVRFDAVFFR